MFATIMNGVLMKADWGLNTKNWVVNQATGLALAAVAIAIVPVILKKQWAALMGILLAGSIGIYFTKNPDALIGIGETLYGIITGG